ncbi:MAG: EpsG family protein [Erysipelotrichaceae bacterium]|nr:EpsG family protein [Erysipelotrichaceae bacterium]
MIKQMGLLLAIMLVSGMYSLGYMNSRAKCVGIITAVMTFFAGLRTWWFGDLIKYYTLFLSCTGSGWKNAVFSNRANIGLRISFRIAGWLGISYDVCIFIISAFVAVTLGLLIYRYSVSIYWSYLMYIGMGFYLFSYSGLKQSIAMGFLCLSMIALIEEKPVPFYFWTICAVIFHAPAAIFLPAYLVTKKEFDAVYIWIIVISLVSFFLFRDRIVSVLSDAYYEEEATLGSSKIVGGRALMILFIMGLGCWLRPVTAIDTVYKKLFSIMLISFMLQCFSIYGNVFTRLTDYYFQFVVLYIPFILERADHQLLMNSARKNRIRIIPKNFYMYLSFGISVFALAYYAKYCHGSLWLLKSFKFVWQINPYTLYGR